jgi:hypothetical protein
MPITIVVMLVLGLAAEPFIKANATEQQLAQNVLLSAIPFILVFISILLTFIMLIVVVARRLNGNISRRYYRPVEMTIIGGIALGIFGMFQPWVFAFFKLGFLLLLISTLSFILWSHITPKADNHTS